MGSDVAAVAPRRARRWATAGVVSLVLLIAAGAAVARFADLTRQPGGLYPDEAAEGVTAQRILADPTGYHPLFIAEDAGREPLYAYLVTAAFAVASDTTVTLRGVSAFLGVLAVLALGLALRRFGIGAALAGMAWAAGSVWMICVARDGFRNVLVPLVGALILAAVIAWSDRPSARHAALAGAAVGLGLWTYQPLKFAPVLVALWLWMLRRSDRPAYDALVADVRWLIGGFLVVGGPMLAVALIEPGNYFGRGAETSLFNVGNAHTSFVSHVLRTLGQFAFVGDPNGRHDVAGMALLSWPLVILAVTGVVCAWRRRRDPKYRLVLLGLVVFLVPPLLATEGSSPHFLRNLGLYPYVGAVVGIGATTAVTWFAHNWRRVGQATGVALVVAALAYGAALGAHAYFTRPVSDRYDAYTFALVSLAHAAAHGPRTAVIVDDYSVFDVQFLDAHNPPTVIPPGQRITPGRFARIVATSRADLRRAVGATLAARATVTAVDPRGHPVVVAVTPSPAPAGA
ncbi:MAG TPA: hypothetical protein VGU73_02055 [Acidimicrobiia bacterium]|nr:hypothetical protein [Acidimicrobiia bacterium]